MFAAWFFITKNYLCLMSVSSTSDRHPQKSALCAKRLKASCKTARLTRCTSSRNHTLPSSRIKLRFHRAELGFCLGNIAFDDCLLKMIDEGAQARTHDAVTAGTDHALTHSFFG